MLVWDRFSRAVNICDTLGGGRYGGCFAADGATASINFTLGLFFAGFFHGRKHS